ncbi:MAG: hypothetical protein HC840_00500 [Leptolyngbyaceae cyanobacterium RM2_2_4]|nr:hypothetical protein [Leptolyngbyaceae cyanobacterium RM2_2_4]
MTIQDLANEVLKAMTHGTRDNGDKFKALRDESPDWMQDLCQDAHARMLPDDHKYEFIFEALNALSDYDSEDDARDSIEADIYTSDLTAWLSSSNTRMEYVNEGVREFGIDADNFDLSSALQVGQLTEKREVFESVLNSLQNRLDEVEAA